GPRHPHSRSCIALLLGAVIELRVVPVVGEILAELLYVALDFLHQEEIGFLGVDERGQFALAFHGANAVDVPGNDFHGQWRSSRAAAHAAGAAAGRVQQSPRRRAVQFMSMDMVMPPMFMLMFMAPLPVCPSVWKRPLMSSLPAPSTVQAMAKVRVSPARFSSVSWQPWASCIISRGSNDCSVTHSVLVSVVGVPVIGLVR